LTCKWFSRYWADSILVYVNVHFDLWLFSPHLKCISVSSLNSIKRRVLTIPNEESSLTFHVLTSKLIRFVLPLSCISVPNLMTFKIRVLKIWSGQYIPTTCISDIMNLTNWWPFQPKEIWCIFLLITVLYMKHPINDTEWNTDQLISAK
jgi:hypothetical protein